MTIKEILAATDFSETAALAVERAFELAQSVGAKVHMVHAYEIPPFPDGMAMAPHVIDDVAKAEETAFQNVIARYKGSPQLGQALLEMGLPRDVILRAADKLGVDLIVLGTHGRRGFQRLLLGSVAEAVSRSARCPVLTIRSSDRHAADIPSAATSTTGAPFLKKVLDASFESALAKVTEALKAEGFGVLTEIDVQETLKQKVGADMRKYRILGACNPPFAHQALTTNLQAGLMMPCNVAVYEDEQQGTVVLAVDPAVNAAAFHTPALDALARQVRDKLSSALDRL